MHSEFAAGSGVKLAFTEVPAVQPRKVHLVWGHGWGQSGEAMLPLAETLQPFASSLLLDFPGFGKSPKPPDNWGTAEYADLSAEWLKSLPYQSVIWIGHSFGGRIGIQLAARHPRLVSGMVLIAAAGLQRRRTVAEKVRISFRRTAFRVGKRFVREGPQLDRLRARLGSSDYRTAGAMRPIFSRVVQEDLTDQARHVSCPTLLLYGTLDTDTPPEFGERFHRLIQKSELALLDGFTHLSILTEGRHQVTLRVRRFLELMER